MENGCHFQTVDERAEKDAEGGFQTVDERAIKKTKGGCAASFQTVDERAAADDALS